MGVWLDGSWSWQLDLNLEDANVSLIQEYHELSELLLEFCPVTRQNDSIIWPFCKSKTFSVLSCYDRLSCLLDGGVLDDECRLALRTSWKAISPVKTKVFVWRLCLNRLSSRDNLLRRGLMLNSHELVCPLCLLVDEDIIHLCF
ncbi:unnamed protein product [Lathyrus sativus]|nr:unnamed protein product [Lathyrus sativus]